MNFDVDDITGAIARIIILLIGLAVAAGGFAVAIIAIRYALGAMA